jgi:hypothetical protein
MKAFGSYVKTLEQLYLDVTRRGPADPLLGEVSAALDGEAGRQLRQLVPVAKLRAAGAYFTGSGIASKAAARLMVSASPKSRILDPACGAGDLLVACAKHLPAARGFRATIADWARCLLGRDLQSEFVLAARYRLALAALALGGWPRKPGATSDAEVFTGIAAGCGLSEEGLFSQATHVIMNPPFNQVAAPAGCDWTRGKVSAAAVFLDECVQRVSSGTRVVAILPDVLRSGERYRRWRERITARARIEAVELLGQFDQWADIDVFLLDLLVTSQPGASSGWEHPSLTGGNTVGSRFEVSVGPLVLFRLSGLGPWRRFIHARNVPAWGTVVETSENKRFEGRIHTPPFIVVRRTSRVGDKHRAVGTVIEAGGPYAVENHLIVLRPIDGRSTSCHELLAILRSPETDEWLNQRIRCRHLTVGVMEKLPLGKRKR